MNFFDTYFFVIFRLARFKAEARKRLEDRKKQEELRAVERDRRFEVIKRLFSEWVSPALGFNKLDYATLTKIVRFYRLIILSCDINFILTTRYPSPSL